MPSKPLDSVERCNRSRAACALISVAPPGLHDFISLTQGCRPGLTHFAPPALGISVAKFNFAADWVFMLPSSNCCRLGVSLAKLQSEADEAINQVSPLRGSAILYLQPRAAALG